MLEVDLPEIDHGELEKLKMEILEIIYVGTKIMYMINKVFMPTVRLPYKVVVNRGSIYMGNF